MIERSAQTMQIEPASLDHRDIVAIRLLTTKQRVILEAVEAFQRATGEACPVSLVARRLRVHHSTIQEHLTALYRKGWLRTPNAPIILRRPIR